MLAEDDEALNHEREHRPRTAGVRSAAYWQPPALFLKDCERSGAIAGVSHLSKKRADTASQDRALYFQSKLRLAFRHAIRAPQVRAPIPVANLSASTWRRCWNATCSSFERLRFQSSGHRVQVFSAIVAAGKNQPL